MEALNFDLFDLEAPEESLALPPLESLGRKPRFTSPAALKPIADIPRSSYRIRPEDVLYPAGAKHKIAANLTAIRLLKELEHSGRSPSDDECRQLIQYSGWGGIPQAFDPDRQEFAREYEELKAALTAQEYVSARASTLNSHYTPKFLIEFLWKIAEKAGIAGGEFG
ncbi:hypothetical protein, partial [Victivallis vadensis]|uniref:hypothetical protein n=1 Tax=Victivallis vadensis TaxID=172901 RepID=UPI003D049D0B